jgi:hypothetical protein
MPYLLLFDVVVVFVVFYVVTPTDGRKSRKTLKNVFLTLKQIYEENHA